MSGDLFGVVLAVVLLALNAFFVGAEFALLAARRSQIEPRAQEGSRAARTTLRAMENVSLVMAGAQLGITVCSLGLGAIGEPAVAHLLEPALPRSPASPTTCSTRSRSWWRCRSWSTSTSCSARWCPRTSRSPVPTAPRMVLSPPMMVIVTVLRPVIAGMNMIANGVLRLLRIEPKDEVHSSFTREEVAALVEESRGEGLIEAEEYDRLAGALGFTEKSVESILMTPDTLATVAPGSTVADVEALCAATGFSRFPVAAPDGDAPGLPPHQGRPRVRRRQALAGHRGQVDPAVRLGPPRRPAPRRAREPAGQGRPHGPGRAPRRRGRRARHPRGRPRGAGRRDPRRGPPRRVRASDARC